MFKPLREVGGRAVVLWDMPTSKYPPPTKYLPRKYKTGSYTNTATVKDLKAGIVELKKRFKHSLKRFEHISFGITEDA